MKRNRLVFAIAIGSAGAMAACNFIVDAGDYKVGGGSGSDASAEDSSMTADSGVGLDSGSLDSGMSDVVQPTDTGMPPADTGTVNETGPLCGTGLPTSSTAFKDDVTLCALAEGCDPGGFDVTMSDCIAYDYPHSNGYPSCFASITSCADYYACFGFVVPTTAQCPTSAQAPYCTDAGAAVNCGSGYYSVPSVENCPALGGPCGVFSTDAGAAASCAVVASCSDPSDPTTSYCSGNDIYSCVNGVGYGQNCGSGSTCAVDTFNGTYCYANGGSCSYSGTDTWSCSGNRAVVCTGYNTTGTEFSYDCSPSGSTCVDNADPFGDSLCLAPGCTFNDVQNCSESCNGSSATVCVGGAPYTFDCAHIGSFTGCSLQVDSSLNPYAVCD